MPLKIKQNKQLVSGNENLKMFAKISKTYKMGLTLNAEKYHFCLLHVHIDNMSVSNSNDSQDQNLMYSFLVVLNSKFIFRDYICI